MDDPNWWRQACVYEIYPRSFADANGDGIGDLKGITSKVPYLKALGVDAVWLSPFYPSALKDGGYDVADYRNVDPRIGTLEDFKDMSKALKVAGIRVIVDVVPNHCSEDHPWFQEALKAEKGSIERARFVFRDGSGPGKDQPPNDWQSHFGGPAWHPSGANDEQWYFHLFDASQPDFNWDNQEVREDFLKTLRFWGDLGVAGFRVDVACLLSKDVVPPYLSWEEVAKVQAKLQLRDADRTILHPFFDRDQVLEIYKDWRKVFNEYTPPLTAVGEIFVAPDRKPLYSSPETLGQAFSFDIMLQTFDAKEFKKCIDNQLKELSYSSTTWVLSNHDVFRHVTRYGSPAYPGLEENNYDGWRPHYEKYLHEADLQAGLRRGNAAILLLLGLPGSVYLYQGEELGLPEVDVPAKDRQDPLFHSGKGIGRDGCRVPIPWNKDTPFFGFSAAASHLPMPPWFGRYAPEGNPTLQLYRNALALRRELQCEESLTWIDSGPDVLHFRRPNGWEVVTNFGGQAIDIRPLGVVLSSQGLIDGKLPAETTVWIKPTD